MGNDLLLVAALSGALTVLYLAWEGWHHLRRRACRAARQALQDRYPGWRATTTCLLSHRGSHQGRAVIAVFYTAPDVHVIPQPYKLFSVPADLDAVEELPVPGDGSRFTIRWRK